MKMKERFTEWERKTFGAGEADEGKAFSARRHIRQDAQGRRRDGEETKKGRKIPVSK